MGNPLARRVGPEEMGRVKGQWITRCFDTLRGVDGLRLHSSLLDWHTVLVWGGALDENQLDQYHTKVCSENYTFRVTILGSKRQCQRPPDRHIQVNASKDNAILQVGLTVQITHWVGTLFGTGGPDYHIISRISHAECDVPREVPFPPRYCA